MELGKRIAEIRKEHSLTQEGLAEICNVTRQTISNWENGKSYPDLETLVLISDTFDVSLDVMLKGDRKMVSETTKEQKHGKHFAVKVIFAVIITALIVLGGIYYIESHESYIPYIRINPSDNALKELKLSHNYDSDKRMALTVEQQRLLMSYLDESEMFKHWRPIITVMLGTGMRAGEVTGLRWKDVDLENGTIDVNHTLVFYNRNHKQTYAINTPKTPSSIRTIPMLDSVKEAFLEEKRNQEESGLYCKSIIDGYQDFVFCNRFGEVLNLGVINKALRRIMVDCNEKVWENHEGDDMPLLLPRISCHSFRHTYATRLCESGMNIKVIQGLLGHSDISTTMNIYVDVTKELRDMAMDDLAKYLKEKKIS